MILFWKKCCAFIFYFFGFSLIWSPYLECRRTPDEEDDLSEVRADAVPPEVRAWLASTFTRQHSTGSRKPGESDKPKFRSVAQAIRAGILVERIYRRMSSSSFLQFPAEVARNLKVTHYHFFRSVTLLPFNLLNCTCVYS